MNKEIAGTILQQLGGNRFIAMTGAKQFSFDDEKMSFKIGRNGTSANYVSIKLNAMDTYDMTFERVTISRKTYEVKRKEIATHEGLYYDMLQPAFTETTGLYTSL